MERFIFTVIRKAWRERGAQSRNNANNNMLAFHGRHRDSRLVVHRSHPTTQQSTSLPEQIQLVSDDLRRWHAANPAVHRTQNMRLRVRAGIFKLKRKAPAS